MKCIKKLILGIVCSAQMISGIYSLEISAEDHEILPYYEVAKSVSTYLAFESNVANCSVIIRGQDHVTKIAGTVKLFDETDNMTVDMWAVYEETSVYSSTFYANVISGHEYTLSFSGAVYDANGNREEVSALVTKKN